MGSYVKSIPPDKLEEFATALAAVHVKYELLLRFGIETGYRVSDCLKMRAGRFSKRLRLFESKTSKFREVEISDELLAHGHNYIEEQRLSHSDALFFSARHRKYKPLSRAQVWVVFSRVAASLGISNIGAHSMRKAFAMNLMQETNSIHEVQKALGHKHVETTLRYLFNFEKLGDILGLV